MDSSDFQARKCGANWSENWSDNHMRRTLLFFIPYFVFNMFDLITTKIALSSGAALCELNPFYRMLPFNEILKIISPFFLLALCVFLYRLSRTEESRRKIGVSSARCMLAISILFAAVTANNVCWLILSA